MRILLDSHNRSISSIILVIVCGRWIVATRLRIYAKLSEEISNSGRYNDMYHHVHTCLRLIVKRNKYVIFLE